MKQNKKNVNKNKTLKNDILKEEKVEWNIEAGLEEIGKPVDVVEGLAIVLATVEY